MICSQCSAQVELKPESSIQSLDTVCAKKDLCPISVELGELHLGPLIKIKTCSTVNKNHRVWRKAVCQNGHFWFPFSI